MSGASATTLSSSESIKAYVDAQTTDEIAEGSAKYYTDERVDDRVANLITAGVNVAKTYDDAAGTLEIRVPYENIQDTVGQQLVTNGSHTGITASYDDAGDAAIDLAISSSHIRGLFSAGGDLSYNSSTGQFSFTNDAGDIESVSVSGVGLSGGGSSGAVTITSNATDSNTGSTIVARDAGGDFSAGTITASLTGDVTGRADDADAVKVTATGDVNQNLLMVFTDTTTTTNNSAPLYKHSPIYYNPLADTLNAGNFSGLASSAKYADLAERYEPDADYEPGTVVVLGGEKEITVTDQMSSTKVAGVISTDPGYLMNAETNGLPVALRGRVPTKVIGSVQKGDVLITSTTPGFAMAAAHPQNVSASEMIGKALQSKADSGEGVIEALI